MNPIEVEDILRLMTASFADPQQRTNMATVNRRFRDTVTIERARRAGAMMQGAMIRYRLTHFPPVGSMDQRIRDLVPPTWILFTAMSQHATGQERRDDSSRSHARRVVDRVDTVIANTGGWPTPTNMPPGMTWDRFRQMESEQDFYVEYKNNPDQTLREFFENITNSLHINPINVAAFFDPALERTAPALLCMTFSENDLSTFRWKTQVF